MESVEEAQRLPIISFHIHRITITTQDGFPRTEELEKDNICQSPIKFSRQSIINLVYTQRLYTHPNSHHKKMPIRELTLWLLSFICQRVLIQVI